MSSFIFAERFFKLPELVAMIVQLVHRADLFNLLRVNRISSAHAAALIWREVPGLDVLLALLPSRGPATVHSVDGAAQVLPTAVGHKSQDELGRFGVYAPFVQTLLVSGRHGSRSGRYHFSGFERVQGLKCLLPNLRSLVIDQRTKSLPAAMLHDILSAFYCSSCTFIELRGFFSETGSGVTEFPQALSFIWGGANLRTLVLMAEGAVDDEEWPRLAAGFAAVPSLVCLTLSAFWIEREIFMAVGQLPKLEQLTLVHDQIRHPFDSDLSDELSVPHGSFAALTRLECVGNWAATSLASLTQFPPLFSNVRSVHLSARSSQQHDVVNLFSGLGTHATHLSSIIYRASTRPLTMPELAPLMEIPLKQLELKNARLDWDYQLDDMLQSCPAWHKSLVHFAMPAEFFPPDTLLLFAEFASLRTLCISLDLEEELPPRSTAPGPISRQTLRLESPLELAGVSDELLEGLAALLMFCWHDVELAMYEDLEEPTSPDSDEAEAFKGLVRKIEKFKLKRETCRGS
ncbi:hypothetical protein FS749_015713 [Ceratobasidium sp. UAMH 11750]|nr:hypothetical protein FS749_015713 [Ceratobasidium sp. UAMH 11750]